MSSNPERMCSSCRMKKPKTDLFRLCKVKNVYNIDINGTTDGRGLYVCKDPSCIQKLSKNKKYKIDIEVLTKLLDLLKKEKKKLTSKLELIAKSKAIVFGIKITREKIWKAELDLVIIASDINESNKEKILHECKEKNVSYIFGDTKQKLGEAIGKKEVNVIGILDPKISKGLINSLGGEAIEST